MSVPLARRLAGPSFSLNVRYDQAWMTKRREQARQELKIGDCKCDFVSEYEVFDVAEGEILVSKQAPGRISDGYARVFSTVNGWQGLPLKLQGVGKCDNLTLISALTVRTDTYIGLTAEVTANKGLHK